MELHQPLAVFMHFQLYCTGFCHCKAVSLLSTHTPTLLVLGDNEQSSFQIFCGVVVFLFMNTRALAPEVEHDIM